MAAIAVKQDLSCLLKLIQVCAVITADGEKKEADGCEPSQCVRDHCIRRGQKRLIQFGRWNKGICLCDAIVLTEKQRSLPVKIMFPGSV